MLKFWPFKRDKVEKRSAGSGFTSEVMQFRQAYITGRTGLGELTGVVSACVGLWQSGFAIADVEGTDLLTRNIMAMLGRSLALRGEALFKITELGLIPASDWDVSTRAAVPVAYRLSLPEAGGGRSETVLAGEVLHFRINVDPAAPWLGVSPLRTAALTAGLLHAIESALSDAWADMPFGSQVVPMPEQPETDNTTLARSFRGQRGRVLLRESVAVTASGGPQPQTDWRPSDLTPDLQKAVPVEALTAARELIALAYGVLPALLNSATTGPMTRECQRHLAQWMLQPLGEIITQEASEKLGQTVAIDVLRPTQSFDAGGAARAVNALVEAMVAAKAGGLDPAVLAAAFRRVDWES